MAFALGDDGVQHWIGELAVSLAARRDLLCAGLEAAGFAVVRPQGTYFVIADAAAHLDRLGLPDGAALCRALPELAGVVAVPVGAFTRPGSAADDALRGHVRFTFVKREDVLREASERLRALSTRG